MAKLKLYGAARSRATRNTWLLNEIALDYEQIPVMQTYRLKDPEAHKGLHTRGEEFLKIHPPGHIPALDDNGLVLGESLAINLYLAKKYGGALGPQSQSEDALMTQWSFWAALDCEPHTIEILYNRAARPPEERDEKKVEAAAAALAAPFAVLNGALAGDGFVTGGRFTVADINVAEIIRYARPVQALFDAAPHVDAWLKKLHARPAFQKMWAAREAEPV